jgi:ribonuclease P protein component
VISCTIPADHFDSQTPARIGFTITKKLGNAVIRNRIRRRLRHLVPSLVNELELVGWDIVLLARPEATTRAFADLDKDFRWAIRKLRAQQAEKASNTTTD